MEQLLNNLGIKPTNEVYYNLTSEQLTEKAVEMKLGLKTKDGALVVTTGEHTGRAAKDKYVVSSPKSDTTIDWANGVNKMSRDQFDQIKKEILGSYKEKDLFVQVNSVGADEHFNMNAILVSPSPTHALFMNHMFREKREKSAMTPYTIYHSPFFGVDPQKCGVKSKTVIAICFESAEVLICGTRYAGEVKKAIFSIMNYLLPEEGILPMHAGANIGEINDVSVFFGLSGTGKTTLSTDTGRRLIGDDEHGLGDHGTFNFEGGCYAKSYNLSEEAEPEIFATTKMPTTILENVVYSEETNTFDFSDKSITENGRVSYPLEFIPNIVKTSNGPVPNNIFFLCADAFGVLPPVSKLTLEQAKYYFLSGYTAKLAGTEMGVTEPQAAFSTCFGAPFMMRPAMEYADLLASYVAEHKINVWLVNTGWTAGGYGEGYRFPIRVTRSIIRLAQSGRLAECEFKTEANFGLSIPTNVEGIDEKLLNPSLTWSDEAAYTKAAQKLKGMFETNYKKYM